MANASLQRLFQLTWTSKFSTKSGYIFHFYRNCQNIFDNINHNSIDYIAVFTVRSQYLPFFKESEYESGIDSKSSLF